MSHKEKYVLLLNPNDSAAVKKTENELDTKIASSAELNSQVRAENIYEAGEGLFLKNLDIVIVENTEKEQLDYLQAQSNSPISHFEESKMIFHTAIELEILEEIKTNFKKLDTQLAQLENELEKLAEEALESLTWNLELLGLRKCPYKGAGIDIAILDTGFYADHPDFQNRNISGKSFVPDQTWDQDSFGHGTHCTGIAAGSTSSDNHVRYGVASEANIAISKVLNDSGNGSLDWILDAIDNSVEKKHKVISMSLGASVDVGEKPNPIFEHVGQKALDQNCLIIAAAGNESRRPQMPRPVNLPANCLSIMAVAAIDKKSKVASFSNAGINAGNGGKVDVCAPGVGVLSSYSKNHPAQKMYEILNGTSMATPHVSGLAAIFAEMYPNISAVDLWQKIEKTAKALPNQLVRDVGKGIVQFAI